MSTIPASVGILTFNSGATLRRALESVKEFDDIVVCDGGSTDDTLKIAAEFGARVITQDPQFKSPDGRLANFSGVRNQLIGAAKHDWFLYIDSDEAASQELCQEVRAIASGATGKDTPVAYRIPMRIVIKGREISCSSNYPGWQTRLFRRSSGLMFIKTVHERLSVELWDKRVGQLAGPWYVYMDDHEVRHYVRANMRYIRMQAKANAAASFGAYISRDIVGMLIISLKVLLKTVWGYLRCGTQGSMPLSVEWGRFLYPLVLIYYTTKERYGR